MTHSSSTLPDSKPEKSSISKAFNLLLNLTLIFLIGWYAYKYHGLLYASTEVKDETKAQVIMYSTKWCPYCIQARAFFAKNGIPYYDYNVNDGGQGEKQFTNLGGGPVPQFIIKKQLIRGLQTKRLTRLLNIKE